MTYRTENSNKNLCNTQIDGKWLVLTFLQMPQIKIMGNVLHHCPHILRNGSMSVRNEGCDGDATSSQVLHT